MENQTTNNEQTPKDPTIAFSASEFNLEEFDFKPLNEGLGFHQEERKNGILPTKATKSQNISVTRGSSIPKVAGLGVSNPKVADKGLQSMNALSAFYEESQSTEQLPVEEVPVQKIEKALKTAAMTKQFGAWLIDLLIVCALTVSLLALFVLVSGLSFEQFYQVIGPNDLMIFGASAFSIFFLSYFSILDLQTTPGKSVLKLRLVREDNADITLKDSFIRSFITLVSFVALGLPCFIDFQGKLTDTKVVEDV
jgi:uncharacterized RDD family membrane protein YckC